jgi:hypothetical protein
MTVATEIQHVDFSDDEADPIVGTAAPMTVAKPQGFIRAHLVWVAIAAAAVWWVVFRKRK